MKDIIISFQIMYWLRPLNLPKTASMSADPFAYPPGGLAAGWR
jgi:hypothetical protein